MRSGQVAAHSITKVAAEGGSRDECPLFYAEERGELGFDRPPLSRMVISGKRGPHGRPSGAMEAGPVVPWQPPRTLGHTTKKRLVSMALLGPTILFHQPLLPDLLVT